MALVSPGVEVTVIDESNYIPAATNSVPYFLIATAQNKISGSGVGVAAGTLEANAGKVYLITSQRDLAATFGVPFFYKTAAGTPINGYELNEYGLLAAYSALGISNRAYVQRANIDLAELTATLVRPTGAPADGTYWLDTSQTSWGIFQWNQSTGEFTPQVPHIVTNTVDLDGMVPKSYIGNIGDYAVVTAFIDAGNTRNYNTVFYKNLDNVWVEVGTNAWKRSWPTVQGTNSVIGGALTAGDKLILNTVEVEVPAFPNNTLTGLVNEINALNIPGITAETNLARTSNKLWLYADCDAIGTVPFAFGEIDIDPTSSAGLLDVLGIDNQEIYFSPALQQSYSYATPRWRITDPTAHPTGSVWNIMNNVNGGDELVIKRWDATLGTWVPQACPVYANTSSAVLPVLDPTGGGKNIPVGTLMARVNADQEYCPATNQWLNLFTTEIFFRFATGATTITGVIENPTFTIGNEFEISYTLAGSTTLAGPFTVELLGNDADAFATALSAALPSGTPVSVFVNSDGALTISHSQGGGITAKDTIGSPMADAGFNATIEGVRNGNGSLTGSLIISHWQELEYISSDTAPDQDPVDGRYWYYSATNQVDIMIENNGRWVGYRTIDNDQRGYDLTQTDPNGPIISATAPTKQSNGTDLVLGDLWIDTSNLEMYPMIRRWQNVNGVLQWVAIDNTDQTTENGVLFADARWAPNGTTDPIVDPIPSITSLLTSNYLDIDAPDPGLYPGGMLLFNTRRSGFNVKTFRANYFNGNDFDFQSWSSSTAYTVGSKVNYLAALYVCIQNASGNAQSPTNTNYWAPLQTNTWVTAAGNRSNGSPYMGRQAVRQLVVAAMKSAIDTQDTLREEQVQFNLLACPQYPELIVNMVALNNERSNTGFVVGDTPLRLPPTGTDIAAWATNTPGVSSDAEAGLVTSDPYLGVFYPSCQTTDLGGSVVVQPPSHMMVRTIIRNDEVAFPWLAPAGVRRGIIDNADAIGYVNGQTGEFVTIATGQGLRDTLYENKINPITFIPGVGITNYGNKTESAVTSALDRINVARLVAFIRGRLTEIGKTFVFEPNDQITRNEITNAIDGLMIDLVAKRGIYDYLIVCDDSNNTPARIDRNELWVDIAIEPVKAVEFIYIPLRIKNTGEIAAGTVASSQTV